MRHSWKHEQTNRICRFCNSYRLHHALVIIDAVERWDKLIAPAVKHQQLSVALEKLPQVRIDMVDGVIIQLVRQGNVLIEIEAVKIRIWVLENHILLLF